MVNKTLLQGISIALFLIQSSFVFSQNKKSLSGTTVNISGYSASYTNSWIRSFNAHYHTDLKLVSIDPNDVNGGVNATIDNLSLFQQNLLPGIQLLSSKPEVRNAVVMIPFSSGFEKLSLRDIILKLENIYNESTASGNRCFVITPQPRTDGEYDSPAQKKRLADIKDAIISRFGENSINFWDGFYNPADTSILAAYDAGDHLHFNYEGQKQLYERVLEKNVFHLQSGQLHMNIRSGRWFDIIAPAIVFFAVFPEKIDQLRDRILNDGALQSIH